MGETAIPVAFTLHIYHDIDIALSRSGRHTAPLQS